jgi:hypothetical protein
MKKVSEPKATRVRVTGRVDKTDAQVPANERVRVVRVSGAAGRPVRWHVTRRDEQR